MQLKNYQVILKISINENNFLKRITEKAKNVILPIAAATTLTVGVNNVEAKTEQSYHETELEQKNQNKIHYSIGFYCSNTLI